MSINKMVVARKQIRTCDVHDQQSADYWMLDMRVICPYLFPDGDQWRLCHTSRSPPSDLSIGNYLLLHSVSLNNIDKVSINQVICSLVLTVLLFSLMCFPSLSIVTRCSSVSQKRVLALMCICSFVCLVGWFLNFLVNY